MSQPGRALVAHYDTLLAADSLPVIQQHVGPGASFRYVHANGHMYVFTTPDRALDIISKLQDYDKKLFHIYPAPWEDRFLVASVYSSDTGGGGDGAKLAKDLANLGMPCEVRSQGTNGTFYIYTSCEFIPQVAEQLARNAVFHSIRVLLVYYLAHWPAQLPIHAAYGLVGEYRPYARTGDPDNPYVMQAYTQEDIQRKINTPTPTFKQHSTSAFKPSGTRDYTMTEKEAVHARAVSSAAAAATPVATSRAKMWEDSNKEDVERERSAAADKSVVRNRLTALGLANPESIFFHGVCYKCGVMESTYYAQPCFHKVLCDTCMYAYRNTDCNMYCPDCLAAGVTFARLVPLESATLKTPSAEAIANSKAGLALLGIDASRPNKRHEACVWCNERDVEYRSIQCLHYVFCAPCYFRYVGTKHAHTCPQCFTEGVNFEKPVFQGAAAKRQQLSDQEQIDATLRSDLHDLGFKYVVVNPQVVQLQCGRCRKRAPATRAEPCGHANFCEECLAAYLATPLATYCPQCLQPKAEFEPGVRRVAGVNANVTPLTLPQRIQTLALLGDAGIKPRPQHLRVNECARCFRNEACTVAQPCGCNAFCANCLDVYLTLPALREICPVYECLQNGTQFVAADYDSSVLVEDEKRDKPKGKGKGKEKDWLAIDGHLTATPPPPPPASSVEMDESEIAAIIDAFAPDVVPLVEVEEEEAEDSSYGDYYASDEDMPDAEED